MISPANWYFRRHRATFCDGSVAPYKREAGGSNLPAPTKLVCCVRPEEWSSVARAPQAVPGLTGQRRQAAFALLGSPLYGRTRSGRSNGVVSCFRRLGTSLAQDQVRELAQLSVRVGRAEPLFDVEQGGQLTRVRRWSGVKFIRVNCDAHAIPVLELQSVCGRQGRQRAEVISTRRRADP